MHHEKELEIADPGMTDISEFAAGVKYVKSRSQYL